MWGGATYAVLTDESLSIGSKTDERTGVLGQNIEGARSGDGWKRWAGGRQVAGRRAGSAYVAVGVDACVRNPGGGCSDTHRDEGMGSYRAGATGDQRGQRPRLETRAATVGLVRRVGRQACGVHEPRRVWEVVQPWGSNAGRASRVW
jgi:hypothetical protein